MLSSSMGGDMHGEEPLALPDQGEEEVEDRLGGFRGLGEDETVLEEVTSRGTFRVVLIQAPEERRDEGDCEEKEIEQEGGGGQGQGQG